MGDLKDYPSCSQMKGFILHKPKNVTNKKTPSVSQSFAQNEFLTVWKDMTDQIKDIQKKFYQETLLAVLKFVQRSSKPQAGEIPAAVIHLGLNMPDHSSIFQQLNELLKSNNNYTVVLDSKKCHISSKFFQLISLELAKQLESNSSSGISTHKEKVKKPVIILIQDVETFSTELLEEIIFNSKIYIKKLPIVLIFGMSSKMMTLHTVLSQRVLCYLGIETFQPFAIADHLTRIIQEVLIPPSQPFKFGPRVFQLMVETVLYHDFSVSNLNILLKYCLFEHFYSNKASILCCSAIKMKNQIASLKNDELLFFKQLPSFRSYIENNPEISDSLTHNSAFKALLEHLLKNLFEYQNHFMLSLKVFNYFIKDLPANSFGNQYYEIYLMHLDKVSSSKGFSEVNKFLNFQSQRDLLDKFKSCESILKNQDCCTELLKLITESIEMISDLEENDFKCSNPKPKLENFRSRFEMQEALRSNIMSKRSKFELLRTKIVDDLMNYFKNLHSPLLLPLHETLFFDDIFSLKQHLMPSPRVVFCNALSNPYKYLHCKCCKTENATSSLPDTSILYSLHLDCGRLINLHDWMENFKNVIGNNYKKRRTTKTEASDSLLAIRFLHSASELEILGFTKSTKQKMHHVIRLIFGIS